MENASETVSKSPTKSADAGGESSGMNAGPMANETVYEMSTTSSSGRSALESPSGSHVVSERVQNLASQIYTELQKIINRCQDDEEAVSGLMPLVVNVLESLDLALIENQQLQVELELSKDDGEQLMNAIEKEKTAKKKIESKLMEMEFAFDEERAKFQQKVESLENIVKMFELRAKNTNDHASRLEEKEHEMKKEYQGLHERYNELLRSHCDLMERVKILMGDSNSSQVDGPSGPQSLNAHIASRIAGRRAEAAEQSSNSLQEPTQDSKNHLNSNMAPRPRHAWGDEDADLSLEDASIIEDLDDIPKDKERDEKPITGMEKEVKNLIRENNELLATKNALNVVKDDLIAKVDELQSEISMKSDEIRQLTAVKDRLKSRITGLETSMKTVKDELDETKSRLAQLQDEEEGIPMAQRKRFTRVEMARVLMERNKYKEKLIDLQEALKWTELIRASKKEPEKKAGLWNFFSGLFGASGGPDGGYISPSGERIPGAHPGIRYKKPPSTSSNATATGIDVMHEADGLNRVSEINLEINRTTTTSSNSSSPSRRKHGEESGISGMGAAARGSPSSAISRSRAQSIIAENLINDDKEPVKN